MDIAELQAKKKHLERTIREELETFQRETGTTPVVDVSFFERKSFDGDVHYIPTVTVTVQL